MHSSLDNLIHQIRAQKNELDRLRPLPVELEENLDTWYRIELTYSSNALEGNTLSRQETALVVEKGQTVEGKTIQEHLEATNHASAWDFLKQLKNKQPSMIDQQDILNIHRHILQKIDDTNAGRYRSVPVRVGGSTVVFSNPVKVPQLMDEFEAWLKTQSDVEPATLAAEIHYRLMSLHPFIDGNGRTARLLMNLVLLQHAYPPAIIPTEKRLEYVTALQTAQLGGDTTPYYQLIYQQITASLNTYLEAAKNSISN